MTTRHQAFDIARQYLAKVEAQTHPPIALVLLEHLVLEESFGWVFFYDSKIHFETGDFHYAIAGNAPFIVDKSDGKVTVTGTALPLKHYIEQYRLHRFC